MLVAAAACSSSVGLAPANSSWCRSPWRHGFCGVVERSVSSATPCRAKQSRGAWRDVDSAAACARLCQSCGHCKYVSFSPLDLDCSWFASCESLSSKSSWLQSDTRHCTLAAADFEALHPATVPEWNQLLARGVISLGSQQNAETLLRMTRGSGHEMSVLGIGSSVTQNGGGSVGGSQQARDGFLVQATKALKDTPSGARSITVHNAGRQGGSMDHFADCFTTYMPPVTHLVIIELTITRFMGPTPLERLLRLLLSARPAPTVLLLRPIHTWWTNSSSGAPQKGACNHATLRALAAHYGVAYVDEFSLVARSSQAAQHAAYTFARLAHGVHDVHPAALLLDSVHPTARGARLLGSALALALRTMMRAAADGRLPTRPSSLPTPLSDGGGTGYSHRCYEFRDPAKEARAARRWSLLSTARPAVAVSDLSRWQYVLDRSKFGATRPGLQSSVPGSAVTLAPLDTRPHSMNATPVVQVEYLSSYDTRMGSAQLECLSGCECRATQLQGRAASRMSVPVATAVAVSASAHCVMRVTLLGDGRRKSDARSPSESASSSDARRHFKLTGLRVGAEEASGPRAATRTTLEKELPPACIYGSDRLHLRSLLMSG